VLIAVPNPCFQTIAPSLTPEIVQADVIDALLQLAVDPIPNIRFNVAKALEVIGSSFGPAGRELAQQRILPMLDQQKTDADADVRYYAVRAMQRIVTAIQA
jgi:serine/threonine-protein phosphatase 2A regulatory subunit A